MVFPVGGGVCDKEVECLGAAHLPSLGVGHLASGSSNGNFLMISTPFAVPL
jgi:hypothetical protein